VKELRAVQVDLKRIISQVEAEDLRSGFCAEMVGETANEWTTEE